MSIPDLDKTVQSIIDDAEHMMLLQILSPQLRLLVQTGRPDLHLFYTAVDSTKLLSEKEMLELRATYLLPNVRTLIIADAWTYY
ncbi:hypothetical protein N7540_012503 [Penicillium herquei]|nr:hypothetical protein N7540_012503 [Penicillium herquei]